MYFDKYMLFKLFITELFLIKDDKNQSMKFSHYPSSCYLLCFVFSVTGIKDNQNVHGNLTKTLTYLKISKGLGDFQDLDIDLRKL